MNRMNMNGMTQMEMLIQHFTENDSISDGEAQLVYRIRSLPRRIMDLKNRGYVFDHQWNRDATGQRYIRYVLVSRPHSQEV